MPKRKQAGEDPLLSLSSEAQVWLQRFQLLDSVYCFLVGKKAIPLLTTVVNFAAHLAGSKESLTEAHVRQLVSIGVVRLEIQKKEKVILQDDFNPNRYDPNERIELVQFPEIPFPSKRGSAKRILLFQKHLVDKDLTNIKQFFPELVEQKRIKEVNELSIYNQVPFLKAIIDSDYFDDQIFHVECIPAREPSFGDIQLKEIGVADEVISAVPFPKLYSHQSEAIAALFNGQHVVISTSTSSGKSMVYNVPVAHSLVTSNATSFFLFPTKALAQDQVHSFKKFLDRCTGLNSSLCSTFDGDTEKAQRQEIRARTRVFFTNPDMLHASIMPQHKGWELVLSRLRFIVIDEAHMYRGVFGSHVANILRRLFRLCYMYGSNPQVICCSASIQNPREHFDLLIPRCSKPNETFLSRDVTVIQQDKDGSPSGRKHFVVWSPRAPPSSSDNPELTASTIYQCGQLFATLVASKTHTIAFCRGRKLTELVLDYTHTILRKRKQAYLIPKVKAYRGGYSVESRRAIEGELFRQDLLGVVSTNALELGIDIGSLECTLHVGFPSSIASMWQQAGRAGRSGKDSMALIVCFDSPLDSYNKSLKGEIFYKPPEAVILDPFNQHIMAQHLQCASLELNLLSKRTGTDKIDMAIFTDDVMSILDNMIKNNAMMHVSDGYRVPAAFKMKEIAIRDIATENFTVVDQLDDNKIIDLIPAHRVFFQVYPSGVYLHQGREYLITKLNVPEKLIFATRCHSRLKYYTTCRDFTDINISTTFISSIEYPRCIQLGIAHVVTHVVGCYSLEKRTKRVLQRTDFSLPPMEDEGHAVWMDIPVEFSRGTEQGRESLHGVNHLLLAVIPHFLLVDNKDLETEHVGCLEQRVRPSRVLVYETSKGGIGLVHRIATLFPKIVHFAKEILDNCTCIDGCPCCVHSPVCSEHNAAISKAGAKRVMDYMAAQMPTTVSTC